MKKYFVEYHIGNAKYVVSFHNGTAKHQDGSDFYDVRIFKNKNSLNVFIKNLKALGYIER